MSTANDTTTSDDEALPPITPDSSEKAVFAAGLMSMLSPVVNELDDRVKMTRQSQIQLRLQIESLSEDLRALSEGHQTPFELDPYMRKIQDSRKRVAVVASILQNAQERLLKLQKNIVKETERRKAMLDTPVPAPPPT